MRKLFLLCAVISSLGGAAKDASGDGEVTFVIGAGVGGNLNALSDPDFDLQTSFKNSPLYGIRMGASGFPIGFEGTLLYSPSALVGGVFDDQPESKVNVLYAEANLLLIFLPGPVQPFVTGGLGLHHFDFQVVDLLDFKRSKFGWNFGGGLKINIEWLTIRVDLRDHVTSFGLGDFGSGILGGLVGLADTSGRVHNAELSLGIGFRF